MYDDSKQTTIDTALADFGAESAAAVPLVLPSALLVVASLLAADEGCKVPELLARILLREANSCKLPLFIDGDGRAAIDALARHYTEIGGADA